jgi:multidrug/hemolysin transport system permease protein
MMITWQIIKRNMYQYFYDKTSIFFSLLSVLLLILVYTLFLGQLQISNIQEIVGDVEGISGMVNSWLIAGLVITSSITVPMSTMSDIVIDKEHKVFQDFYVAPIPRYSIVLAYILSSVIIGFLMAGLTFVLGFLYLGITSGTWLSILSIMSLLGVIIVSVILFSSFSFVILSFVKSTSSAGTVNTLIGTLVGFFAGIYVPFGAFSQTFQNIIQLNPAAQIVTLMRQILMKPYLDVVFFGAPEDVRQSYSEGYGIVIQIFGLELTTIHILLMSSLWIILLMILGVFRLKVYKEN